MGGLPLTSPADSPREARLEPPLDPAWAIQPVLRVDRRDPPSRAALCEAAAMAVVRTEVEAGTTTALARWA